MAYHELNKPKVNLLIRDIMKKKDITMEALAQRLGIAISTLSVKLGGNITLNALYDIAQALDCEIADFFPVPKGYKHWTQVNESIETRKETYFCPKCGTKFQIND